MIILLLNDEPDVSKLMNLMFLGQTWYFTNDTPIQFVNLRHYNSDSTGMWSSKLRIGLDLALSLVSLVIEMGTATSLLKIDEKKTSQI